jgi:hypothetical protein
LIIDSQRESLSDFTEVKKQHAKTDQSIIVLEHTLWDAKAEDYEDEPRFYLELGSDQVPAHILHHIEDASLWSDEFNDKPENLTDDDWLADNLHVLRVPESFRHDFVENMEKALIDFVGAPPESTSRFLPFPKQIHAAQTEFVASGGQNLFLKDNISLKLLFGDSKLCNWPQLINYKYVEQLQVEGSFNYAVHLDLSSTGDATGVAIGRIVGQKVVSKGQHFDIKERRIVEVENLEAPIFKIDGVLRVFPASGEHIDVNILRDLILELKRHLNIRYASSDWIGPAGHLDTWRQHEIISGHRSVDRTPDDYYLLRNAIVDLRILFPSHEVLNTELRRLKRIFYGGSVKIDHPSDGSKDISDSVAGVVGVLDMREGKSRLLPPEEQKTSQTDDSGSSRFRPRANNGFRGIRRWGR